MGRGQQGDTAQEKDRSSRVRKLLLQQQVAATGEAVVEVSSSPESSK